MTTDKRRKARIRARMARTGERYTTARRHTIGIPTQAQRDLTYALRGGQDPDSAALASVLTHHGVTAPDGDRLSEALLFGVAGGLGAGYILWEFAHHNSATLVLGFNNQWQYVASGIRAALERLGIAVDEHSTGGMRGAAQRLDAHADAGRPALVWPDRQMLGHWYLPPHLEAHGGHTVVVYGRRDGRFHIDDRTLAPLTVAEADLHRARARVGSYKNLLLAPRPAPGPLEPDRLRAAVIAGIDDCVRQLSLTSTSFSLPAWRKWGRLMTDARNAKGWPRVFADGAGLVGALMSVWEGVSQNGMTGGHLRDLYTDFLDEAAHLLGADFGTARAALRESARRWIHLGDIAADADDPDFARLRGLTATIREALASAGDDGRNEAARAAAELWQRRRTLDAHCPLDGQRRAAVFARMGETLLAIYELETGAVADLATAVDAVR